MLFKADPQGIFLEKVAKKLNQKKMKIEIFPNQVHLESPNQNTHLYKELHISTSSYISEESAALEGHQDEKDQENLVMELIPHKC